MKSLHLLHCLALCLTLAQQRSVSVEVLPTLAPGQEVSVLDRYEFAPYVILESPLYRAIYDSEKRCCTWIQFVVRGEDVENDNDTNRRWWVPDEMRQFVLPSSAFAGSGYDRGHLRSIQMSRGSAHFEDVNNLAVIIPETPALNRGPIVELENEICDLAETHGWCRVTITMTGDIGDMPNAGPHQIPARIVYLIQSPAGERTVVFENGPT